MTTGNKIGMVSYQGPARGYAGSDFAQVSFCKPSAVQYITEAPRPAFWKSVGVCSAQPLFLAEAARAKKVGNIAAVPFEIRGDGLEKGLALAIPEMLVSELLNRWPEVRFVERMQIEKCLKEQAFQLGDAVDEKSAVKIGRLKGANTLLTGSITQNAGTYVMSASLVSNQSGEVLAQTSIQLPNLEGVFPAIETVADRLMRDVGKPVTGRDLLSNDTVRPSLNAFNAYARGLLEEFRGEQEAAVRTFQQAVVQDPTFTAAQRKFGQASVQISGNEFYRKAFGEALKHNQAVVKRIEKMNRAWLAAREFFEAIRGSQPTVTLDQPTSTVKAGRVQFRFTGTIQDVPYRKALETFFNEAGVRFGSAGVWGGGRNEYFNFSLENTTNLDGVVIEDKNHDYALLLSDLLKSIMITNAYHLTFIEKDNEGNPVQTWEYESGWGFGEEHCSGERSCSRDAIGARSSVGTACPVEIEFPPDGAYFLIAKDANFRFSFSIHFPGKNRFDFNEELSAPPAGRSKLTLSLEEVRNLGSFSMTAERRWCRHEPLINSNERWGLNIGGGWSGNPITPLKPDTWRGYLQNYWQKHSIALP